MPKKLYDVHLVEAVQRHFYGESWRSIAESMSVSEAVLTQRVRDFNWRDAVLHRCVMEATDALSSGCSEVAEAAE